MFQARSALLVVSALISTLAFAPGKAAAEPALYKTHHVSFTVDSRPDVSGRVYYNCDSVESQIENLLEQMGATNIDVDCRGGIESHRPQIAWDSHVDLKFDALQSVKAGTARSINASFRDIKIREWDGCFLLKQAFNEVKQGFVLKNVNGPASCSRSSGSFRVELTTLFP